MGRYEIIVAVSFFIFVIFIIGLCIGLANMKSSSDSFTDSLNERNGMYRYSHPYRNSRYYYNPNYGGYMLQ